MFEHETNFYRYLRISARAQRDTLETRLRKNTHRYSDMLQLAPTHFSTCSPAGRLALCHSQSRRELAA
jgi:hypothetical protein